MEIKKGTILALTKGEYSDYYLMGHVKAVADFDTKVESLAFMAGEPKDPRYPTCHGVVDQYDQDKFVAYLIRKKLVKPYDKVLELFVGSYGRIDAEIMPPKIAGE